MLLSNKLPVYKSLSNKLPVYVSLSNKLRYIPER